MSDPLSVAGGAVGVISLGLQVSKGLTTYYSHFQSYDDEIAHITRKSEALHRLLEDLDEPLRKAENGNGNVSTQVRSSVDACEAGLRRLHAAVEKYGNLAVPTSREDKIRALRKRTLYPFKRATLQDLNNTLEELQANLQLAMNVLTIETGQSLTELTVSISEELSTSAQNTQKYLKSLSAKVDQLALTLQTCQTQSSLYQEPALLALMCDKQENLRNDSIKFLRVKDKRNYSQNISNKGFCSCPRHPQTSESRGYLCKPNPSIFWTRTTNHLPNCPRYRYAQRKDTIGANYTYCTTILSYSITVAMSLTRGAGGLAIAPKLMLRAAVSRASPAFELLDWGLSRMNHKLEFQCSMDHANWILKELYTLFKNGNASPTDVLSDGTSLLHALFNGAVSMRHAYKSETHSQFIQTIDRLVSEVIKAGADPLQRAPISRSAKDLKYERTILDDAVWMLSSNQGLGKYTGLIDEGRHLLAKLFDCGLEIEEDIFEYANRSGYETWESHAAVTTIQQCIRLLEANRRLGILEVPEILESIFRQDETQLRRVLTYSPVSTSQLFGSGITPVHLAVSWPKGLSILLGIGGVVSSYDSQGYTPLFHAYKLEQVTAVRLLLDHDSPLRSHYRSNYCLGLVSSSKDINLQRSFISHLINRRQRLLELALEFLPLSELTAMDLKRDRILDAQAALVASALLQHGMKVDPALKMPSLWLEQSTVYHTAALDPQIADALYEAGFRDIDESDIDGKTPFWYHITSSSFHSPQILQWFRNKGANVCRTRSRASGNVLQSKRADIVSSCFINDSRIIGRGSQTLNQQIAASFLKLDSSDDCTCACSKGGCSVFTSALKNLDGLNTWQDLWETQKEYIVLSICCSICDFLEAEITDCLWVAFDIIRIITFETLGLTHTCHMHGRTRPFSKSVPFSFEEIHEIQEEERFLIQQLEDLIADFETRFTELGGKLSSFLKKYWKPRMDQVRQENNKRNKEEEENMRALGVVVKMRDEKEVGSDTGNEDY